MKWVGSGGLRPERLGSSSASPMRAAPAATVTGPTVAAESTSGAFPLWIRIRFSSESSRRSGTGPLRMRVRATQEDFSIGNRGKAD